MQRGPQARQQRQTIGAHGGIVGIHFHAFKEGIDRNVNRERAHNIVQMPLCLARLKLIVAGGLRAENVGDAIRRLKPWGVDVASGVEASPGVKSPERVKAFVGAARRPRMPRSAE